MTRPLAVLRPDPGNAATAARIEALGHGALRLPLFVIRPVAWTAPNPTSYDSLVLSSANAVRMAGPDLARLGALPVHAVGRATALAAQAAGFTVVAVGEGGVDALDPPGRVLRLVGRDHRPAPAASTITVYASEGLTPDLSGLIDATALLHSPRAAARLAEQLADKSRVAIAAISPAALAAAGPGWRATAVADRPTDDALIAAALTLAD
ncbi:uroporphyrinogen-III synthase [uncultured Sphingomonas sp.]|uniref:uroporphyrinogen-III synthase n=1 Tax=uncultured Sphingomonas sp. TaxID=158754 RepID=UPI0025E6B4D5|nr:uroporphyrinogen-III synthase [uncultured Sphingomonas sp.]